MRQARLDFLVLIDANITPILIQVSGRLRRAVCCLWDATSMFKQVVA